MVVGRVEDILDTSSPGNYVGGKCLPDGVPFVSTLPPVFYSRDESSGIVGLHCQIILPLSRHLSSNIVLE